jgi:heme/copper-type cytochrome/quinol oxidase subunit 2
MQKRRSQPIASASVSIAAVIPLAVKTAAQEGKEVITAMLVVGLIFVGVIAIGQLTHWLRHRRRATSR